MKAAIAVLLCMVAVTSARECDILARLNVKSQWQRAYNVGHDREHFAVALWRTLFTLAPETRTMLERVGSDDTSSPKFIAHALRVLAALDIVVNLLDQPEALQAELDHLHDQHEARHVGHKYFKIFSVGLAHVLPAHLGRCYDKEPWEVCLKTIYLAMHHDKHDH